MRKLVKGQRPEILASNAAAWTQSVLDDLANGSRLSDTQISRYNHPIIKAAIKAETCDKCAYCESKVTHVDHGDIEHVIPKSKVPILAFEWDNLTFACRICNQNKGSYYFEGDDHSQLIDPYSDDPADHFFFYRELVNPRPDSVRGLLTDDKIGISRAPLREKRRERFEFIDGLIRGYLDAPAEAKPVLRSNLETICCADDSEYAASARVYIADVFQKLGV